MIEPKRFCGRDFTAEELSLIQEVVGTCGGISRRELAHTVCELLDWKRPRGGLKFRECQDLLELLEDKGALRLPEKRRTGYNGPQKSIAKVLCKEPYSSLTGSVEFFTPLDVQRVQSREQRNLFKDLVSRYHYLGYAMPFGARLQYLVYVNRPRREVVGCLQFSSPAWRMKARDQWIGWNDSQREAGLQQVVNNSRFLVLAPIRNLASTMLSCTLRQLRSDWPRQYGIEPLLVETLVDRQRFHGGCYRAANWIELGQTSGRGRMDRAGKRHGAAVKTILVYPLVKNAARRLKDGR
ncbi:MAG: DUF4338 domain-containing protein [Desulfobulbaceae bacterium]|nr:DUF4338 domain-containing protein [Desulfobulbaceae bacterium]